MRTNDTAFTSSRDASKAVCDQLVQEAAGGKCGNLFVEEGCDVCGCNVGGEKRHGAVDDDAVPVDVLLRLACVHYRL